MANELKKRGMHVERQMPVPIVYENLKFEEGFRADLLVHGLVVIELKSVDKLAKVHKKQLLTYLRLMDRKLGLLVNFGEEPDQGWYQPCRKWTGRLMVAVFVY